MKIAEQSRRQVRRREVDAQTSFFSTQAELDDRKKTSTLKSGCQARQKAGAVFRDIQDSRSRAEKKLSLLFFAGFLVIDAISMVDPAQK